MSDWSPNCIIDNELLNVTLDDEQKIIYAGVGYHVVGPSGRTLSQNGGVALHSPGQNIILDSDLLDKLQAVVDHALALVYAHEGLPRKTNSPQLATPKPPTA